MDCFGTFIRGICSIYVSLVPKLPNLSQQSLLITGQFDPVCCEEQQLAFKQKVKNSSVVIFERSGHFPRIEEPDKYTSEVIKFIRRRQGH